MGKDRARPHVPMARLAGRRCIVTGAARGIGREIAGTFHAHGATVGLLDLDTSVKEVAAELDGVAAVADVRDTPALAAAVGQLIGELGGVDVLVNNAGILRITPLLDITVDEWDLVMDVNARSMLVATQVAARAMIAAAAPGPGFRRDHRQGHQHGEHGRQARRGQPGALRRVQGRRRVAHPGGGDRARPLRHHRQRHLSGLRAHRHGRRHAHRRRWWRRGARRRRSDAAPRRPTWRRWRCSWRRATATTAPARR